jgi:hypothetical protein
LTPHFGVAATSPSFSAFAKLAVMVDKKQTNNPAAQWRQDGRADPSPSSPAFPPQCLSSEKLVRPSALRPVLRSYSEGGTPQLVDNQARSSPIVPNKAKRRYQ